MFENVGMAVREVWYVEGCVGCVIVMETNTRRHTYGKLIFIQILILILQIYL